MNQLIRHTVRSVSLILTVFATLTLAACGNSGGGGSSSSGSSGGGLATGGFTKTYSPGVNLTYWNSPFTTLPRHFLIMYQASDINGSGNIDAISFRVSTAVNSIATCDNVTIRMGHSSLAQITDTTFVNQMENGAGSMQTVIDNATITIPVTALDEYFSIPLSSSFDYNGVDNLLLEIIRSPACSRGIFFRTENAIGTNSIIWSSDLASPTGSALGGDALFHTKFVFAGGDNQVLALDNTFNNGNTIAPGQTGRTQALILASHIDGSGPITGIAFLANSTTVATEAVVTIRMVHIDPATTDLTSNFDNNFGGATPITVTRDVNVSIGNGATKFWIPLTGTFNYDGASNLLLDISMTVNSGGFDVDYWNVPNSRVVYSLNLADVTGFARSRAFQPVLRFNGAPVQVMLKGNSTSPPVLGGWPSTGAGQTQNLYPPSFVGTGGTVTSISVRLNANSVAATIPNYKIYMGNTAKTTFNTADTYSSNMEINPTLVFDGSFDIPAGLKQGDWVTIPLQNNFTYDPTRNMSILFMADSASPGNNIVSASFDATMFPTHEVGRNNNAVDITGTPDWSWSGIVDVRLNIAK